MYDEEEMPQDPDAEMEAEEPQVPQGPQADLMAVSPEEDAAAEEEADSYDAQGRIEALRQMLNEKAQERQDRSMQFQKMSRGVS